MTLAYAALGSWLFATAAYGAKRRPLGDWMASIGALLAAAMIADLWISLQRPPLRTLGETRWLYAALVPTLGLLLGWRYGTRALSAPSCLLGAAFALTNLLHPEYMDRTLMPALQSPWFVPHVVVYMLAYSALGIAGIVAAWTMLAKRTGVSERDLDLPHRLVLIGLPLLTCGLVFGAFWAKTAWGHYWTWDPKETWAFLTWAVYAAYLHLMIDRSLPPFRTLGLLVAGFATVLVCWFGVNYLPSGAESVHTYTNP